MAKRKLTKTPTKPKLECGLPSFKLKREAKSTKDLEKLTDEIPERINWAQSI